MNQAVNIFTADYILCWEIGGMDLPPGPTGASSTGFFDSGFLIVSSTLKIKQAASVAAVIALLFTSAGSQTHFSKLFAISSLEISTPAQISPIKQFYFKIGQITNVTI